MERKTIEKNKWNRHVSSHQHAQFLQSYEWGEFQESLGREVVFADSCLAVRLPLWRGASYLYCPRGPVSGVSLCVDRLTRADNTLFVRFEPISTEEQVPQGSIKTISIQPDVEWFLDTKNGYDQIFASMHPKTRYNIRLASKKGVRVRTVDERGKLKNDDIMIFCALLAETAHAHEFRLHSESYYRSLIEFFLPKSKNLDENTPFGQLFFAEYNGIPIAAILIMFFGATAIYIHGGSSRSRRDSMAPHLLHDRAIAQTIMLGYRYYNFGGIAPDGSLHHPFSGITRFKKGFGGESLMYSGTYDYPLHKGGYLLYTMGRTLRRALSSFNG